MRCEKVCKYSKPIDCHKILAELSPVQGNNEQLMIGEYKGSFIVNLHISIVNIEASYHAIAPIIWRPTYLQVGSKNKQDRLTKTHTIHKDKQT